MVILYIILYSTTYENLSTLYCQILKYYHTYLICWIYILPSLNFKFTKSFYMLYKTYGKISLHYFNRKSAACDLSTFIII